MEKRSLMEDRRLSAIMFTDIQGYSALTHKNESLALELLAKNRQILQDIFSDHNGRIVKTLGDGLLVEFPSATDAVNSAVEAQKSLKETNSPERTDQTQVVLRIGIHLGEVIEDSGDILGDGVNIAARIEPICDPGGICFTRQVFDQVHNKIKEKIVKVGVKELKNISTPVEIYKVDLKERVNESTALDRFRLAVLPLANMISDPNDQYFADGMTEELISTISKIKELTVISRTSVMKYKEARMPIPEIARELRVGSILEGSVRKAGNRVRITEQLIDVNTDGHLWSQSYDRNLDDVFAIQADIAEQVSQALRIQLLSDERRSIRKKATDNPEAHTLYLKGRFYLNERTSQGVEKSLEYFQKALEKDPDFALAYSGLADGYNILSDYSWMPSSKAGNLAKENAAKALELDQELAEAHASMGLCLASHVWDVVGAEREYKRAIELKPSYSTAYHWYAILLYDMRKYREAQEIERRAIEIDPYSRVIGMGFANTYLATGQAEEGLSRLDRIIELNPDFGAPHFWKSTGFYLLGNYPKAIEEARKYNEIDPGSVHSLFWIPFVLAKSGAKEEARAELNRVMALPLADEFSPALLTEAKLGLDERDEAYALLLKAYEQHDNYLPYFNGYPWVEEYRKDPRWLDIERKMGFVRS
jgi:adenylate cyclase